MTKFNETFNNPLGTVIFTEFDLKLLVSGSCTRFGRGGFVVLMTKKEQLYDAPTADAT